jgi:DNA-binding NarL/FixJ family response regulator
MRIVLVEDHLAYLESFKLAIPTVAPIEVVGHATRARDAFGVIESTEPDVVVSDLMLPDTDAVSLARELRRRRLEVRSMVLTRLGHPLFVRDALRAGILGFALKRESLQSLGVAIQRVAMGEVYLSPAIRERMHINRKLGVGSPVELARLLADSGLVTV